AIATVLAALVVVSFAFGTSGRRLISLHGVRVVVPVGWRHVSAAGDGPVVDPRTVLVVGTVGVRPRASQCQIAAYSIPPGGAVVVVVAWKTATSGGGHLKPGRAPLQALRRVKRPS